MSKKEKIVERLKSRPKDFTYDEARQLLNMFGFVEYNKGKTSGSKVEFINEYNKKIELHKPHPGNILKIYQVNKILVLFKEWRIL